MMDAATSLPALFAHSVERAPDKLAVIDPAVRLTYAQLDRASGDAARALAERGLAGSAIAVAVPAGAAYVASILAIARARGVFAPLELAWPDARLVDALRLIDPPAVIATAVEAARLRRLIGESGVAAGLWIAAAEGRLVEADPAASAAPRPHNDLAASWRADSLYLVHTSGSTGTPNAVEGAHRSLAWFIAWQAAAFAIDAGCVVAQLAPTSFDVSLRDIFLPLATGGTIVVPSPSERYHPILMPRWIAAHRIDLIHAVPSAFTLAAHAVAANPALRGALASVRRVFLSGERLYAADAAAIHAALPPGAALVNLFGPSECTLIKTYHHVPRDPVGPAAAAAVVPIGRAVPDCRVRLEPGDASAAAPGEIVLESPYLARGYYRNPALTAARFSDVAGAPGWRAYRTGDLGFFDGAGVLHFAGRRDHQVKISGNRVELGEIEACARTLAGVEHAVVTAAATGDALSCVYVSAGGVAASALRAHLRGHLPAYMVPAEIVAWPALPLLPSGKADRARIAALLLRTDTSPT